MTQVSIDTLIYISGNFGNMDVNYHITQFLFSKVKTYISQFHIIFISYTTVLWVITKVSLRCYPSVTIKNVGH